MFDPGADLSLYVQAWGITVRQALLYGFNDDGVRKLNLSGKAPKVDIVVAAGQIVQIDSLSSDYEEVPKY